MSTPNSSFSDRVAILGALDPQTISNTSADSDWAGLAEFGKIAFVIAVGTVADSTTVDAALYEATDSSGTDEAALSGKAITQLGATDDNKQCVIEVSTDELSSGFTHVACRVTVTGSTADASVLALGTDARVEPAYSNDIASVAEIVA